YILCPCFATQLLSFSSLLPLPPPSPLFPYTTLFRSSTARTNVPAPTSNTTVRTTSSTTSPLATCAKPPPEPLPPSRKVPCRSDLDRKSTRLNSSHVSISYAVFCLKKKIDNLSLILIA